MSQLRALHADHCARRRFRPGGAVRDGDGRAVAGRLGRVPQRQRAAARVLRHPGLQPGQLRGVRQQHEGGDADRLPRARLRGVRRRDQAGPVRQHEDGGDSSAMPTAKGSTASTPASWTTPSTAASSSSCASRTVPRPRARSSASTATCGARFTCRWRAAWRRAVRSSMSSPPTWKWRTGWPRWPTRECMARRRSRRPQATEAEVAHLQALPAPWRGDIAAARPQGEATEAADAERASAPRPAVVVSRIAAAVAAAASAARCTSNCWSESAEGVAA